MSPHSTKNPTESRVNKDTEDRDRLRDIIVVFVTYPLTPSKKTSKLAEQKPWLEFVSLLLKVALAAYAIYEATTS